MLGPPHGIPTATAPHILTRAQVSSVMATNIAQSMGTMLDTVVF